MPIEESEQENKIIVLIMITAVIFSAMMGALIGNDWLLEDAEPISIMLIICYVIFIMILTYPAYRL